MVQVRIGWQYSFLDRYNVLPLSVREGENIADA
jgi:hypothetical protein